MQQPAERSPIICQFELFFYFRLAHMQQSACAHFYYVFDAVRVGIEINV